MNSHVSNIDRTCYLDLRRLASNRSFLISTAAATLVSAFVLSRIDYCDSLLFGSTHDVTFHLQRIQNYASRVILSLPKSSSITIHLRSLHWLPVKVRSTYKIACLCYHCHSSTAPSCHWHAVEKSITPATLPPAHTPCLFSIYLHTVRRHLVIACFLLLLFLPGTPFQMMSVWPITVVIYVSFEDILVSFSLQFYWYFFLITVHMYIVWPCYWFVDGLS